MNRLLRWLDGLTNRQGTDPHIEGPRRVVHTVERQERTILIGTLPSGSFDVCPLCGNKLGPAVHGPDVADRIPRQLHE